jgi:hypothetical protein
MQLVHGAEIQHALREVLPTRIAVAYVGIDWATYIEANLLKEIVLSPTLGTNPSAIMEIADQIGWENVYFLDNLHAKIYLGEAKAAVGSFNLTANGLSAEGLEEAGFIVQESRALAGLNALLESYKSQAAAMYPTPKEKLERVAALRAQWDRAVKTGAIRNDAKSKDLPVYQSLAPDEFYVCWVAGEVEYNEDVVPMAMIEDAVSFLEDDKIQPDRWILCWHARNDGFPDERRKPYWLHVDEVLSNGALDEQYTKLAIERNDRCPLPPPFELKNGTVSALWTVLHSGLFPAFLGNVYPWSINPTLPQLPAFLEALQGQLAAVPSAANSNADQIDSLRQIFAERIRTAMDISLQKKYVTHSIDGMLQARHAVDVAKLLVRPGADIKSGLKKLARAKALHLSFESIMLEKQFQPLFLQRDLECARFNLMEADPSYHVR